MVETISRLAKRFLEILVSIGLLKRVDSRDVQKVIDLYHGEGFGELFVKIRFWDAPLVEIEKALPKKGTLVDLGCGEGILTNYIAIKSSKRKVIGVEINKKRIAIADRRVKNTKYLQGSILDDDLPTADTLLISNVLHHLPSKDDQVLLIKSCHKRLREGNKLIIAEVDRGVSWQYLVAWLVDAFVVPILFEGKLKDSFYHRSGKEWKSLLEKVGFTVKSKKTKGGPFPDVIIVATKK